MSLGLGFPTRFIRTLSLSPSRYYFNEPFFFFSTSLSYSGLGDLYQYYGDLEGMNLADDVPSPFPSSLLSSSNLLSRRICYAKNLNKSCNPSSSFVLGRHLFTMVYTTCNGSQPHLLALLSARNDSHLPTRHSRFVPTYIHRPPSLAT